MNLQNIHDKCFFTPRKGERYEEGLKGLRTLVVGAFHVCSLECPHKSKCQDPVAVRDMDRECPCYEAMDDKDYYRLGNSNEIEIRSFIDKEAAYPAYKAFTCYMLGLKSRCPSESRKKLWESVAFTNFLQHFVADEEEVLPASAYEGAYRSLLGVIEELKPLVIFAWDRYVKDCMVRHPESLKYIGKADMGFQIEVYLFTPRESGLPQKEIDKLRQRYNVVAPNNIKIYHELTERWLGEFFIGDEAGDNKAGFPNFLKKGVKEQLICLSNETFAFCEEKHHWKSYHKGFFIRALKNRFDLNARGANLALESFFNCKGIYKYPQSKSKASQSDELLDAIKNWFGIR